MAKNESEIEYLNAERLKLWERLTQLEEEISKKTSDYEKEAKQSSKKASEYRNRSNDAKDQSIKNAEISLVKLEEIKGFSSEIVLLKEECEKNTQKISEFYTDIESRSSVIEEHLSTLEENFENNNSFVEKLETFEDHFEKSNEIYGKIEVLQKSIQSKKRKIDNLHRELFGYTETEFNDEGAEVEIAVEGLKDQLESTYDNLEDNLISLEKDFTKLKEDTLSNYNSFVLEKESNYKEKMEKWDNDYDSVLDKINKLLPNAMTTGLSYAYSEKKESEVDDSKKFAKNFQYAAFGLIGMSLIPFILSVFFIYQGKTLIQVIDYSPRFVLAIIPMYIPILWIAYSSNKKLNLSKRLIEEYTHKEVLSKTFEGLSHQINNIEEEDVHTDLKIKLLYNILSVSSENPGKLISDYNKSDHPLMDALDKSASLSDAVGKLENIPGLSKIARILDKKAKRILKEQAEKVDDTLGEVVGEALDVSDLN
ncbi:hypothetical protein [Flavobacterium sp. UGB4466]|uniref:hypothetical protein n=1 Tax=Flavobacterium sp. UGB4466 TaxID=2730889 RepID=UPI00192C8B5B|nr:hypothetical protein [Flavobacterium sp. UGB4466]